MSFHFCCTNLMLEFNSFPFVFTYVQVASSLIKVYICDKLNK